MIPTAFKLGGNTWRVRMQKHIVHVSNNDVIHLYGDCDIEKCLIRIAENVDGRPCSQDTIIQTFIHEFIHAALYTIGKKFDDEELVVGLENMVWQYLRTCKESKRKTSAKRVQLDDNSKKRAGTKRAARRKS